MEPHIPSEDTPAQSGSASQGKTQDPSTTTPPQAPDAASTAPRTTSPSTSAETLERWELLSELGQKEGFVPNGASRPMGGWIRTHHLSVYVAFCVLLLSVCALLWVVGNLFATNLTNLIIISDVSEGVKLFLAGSVPSFLLLDIVQVLLFFGLVLFALLWWFETFLVRQVNKKSLELHHYLFWWLSTLLVVAFSAGFVLSFLVQNLAIRFLDSLSLLAFVTALMLMLFVWLGTDGDYYKAYVKPHQGVWIAFIATILFMFVLINYSYNYIGQRIAGMMATRRAFIAQIQNADTSITQIAGHSQQLSSLLQLLNQDPFLQAGVSASSNGGPRFESGATPTAPPPTASIYVSEEQKENARQVLQTSRALIGKHAAAILAEMQAADEAFQRAETLYPLVMAEEARLYAALDSSAPPTLPQPEPAPTEGIPSLPGAAALAEEPSPSPTPPTATATPAPNSLVAIVQRNRQALSLLWAREMFSDTQKTVNDLEQSSGETLDRIIVWSEADSTSRLPQDASVIEIRLAPEALRARQASARLLASLNSLEVVVSPLVLTTIVLLSLFVLLPWTLLLLFFFRKRDNLAAGIVKDLIRLEPSRSLLKRVLGLTDVTTVILNADGTVQETNQSKPFIKACDFADLAPVNCTPDPRLEGLGPEMQEQVELLKSVRVLPVAQGEGIRADSDVTGVFAFNRVREALAKRVFSDFEYILTLSALTAILGVGWFFVFYPSASTGLAILILQNTGFTGLTQYLVGGLTPLTAGFIGAYLWVAYMLLRRYFYGDLYPSAFLQAILRFLIVFILSLILAAIGNLVQGGGAALEQSSQAALNLANTIAPSSPTAQALPALALATNQYDSLLLLIAFFIGIFPDRALRYFSELANRIARNLFPLSFEAAPLTKLDGFDVFIETRLLEENIENVQGLATAPIQELVVNTYFPASQIVDWVDQAILYMHCGNEGEWFAYFRKATVRNATDFLDRLGIDLNNPVKPDERESELSKMEMRAFLLAEAIRTANAATNGSVNESPASLRRAAIEYLECIISLGTDAKQFEKLRQAIPIVLDTQEKKNQANTDLVRLREVVSGYIVSANQLLTLQAMVKIELESWKVSSIVIDQLKQAIDSAQKTSFEIRDTSHKLMPALAQVKVDDAASVQENAAWRTLLSESVTQAQQMYNAGRGAYQQIMAHFPPPPLTPNLLLTLADVMVPDQNLRYVLNWYAWTKKEANDSAVAAA